MLVSGDNVVLAVTVSDHASVLVELGPTSALRLVAAVIAATAPRSGDDDGHCER
jgi:hypothetical protein